MRILALDLGKYKTVACEYEAENGRHRFATVLTTPKALHDLIKLKWVKRRFGNLIEMTKSSRVNLSQRLTTSSAIEAEWASQNSRLRMSFVAPLTKATNSN